MNEPHAELLTWCARAFVGHDAGAPPLAQMDDAEWSRFLTAAITHSCIPIAWRALEPHADGLPAGFADDLRRRFETNVVRNLRLAGELVSLLGLLERRGVAAVPWKGPILAERAYGDLRLRQFFDLDILVRRADLLTARDALVDAGYRINLEMDDVQLATYVDHMGELELERESDGLWVEIHTAVVPSYFSRGRPSEDMWKRLVPAKVARANVTGLDMVDEMEALAIHGSKHRWERLAWIVDIAVMSRLLSEHDWVRLLSSAHEHGTQRMVYLALVLSEDVCAAPLPESVASAAHADRVATRLATEARATLFDPQPGRLDELKFHVRMRERWLDQLRYLVNVVYTPSTNDWQTVRLPKLLFPLFVLTRPVRLAFKFGRRAVLGSR